MNVALEFWRIPLPSVETNMHAALPISIQPVRSPKQWRDFFRLKQQIHQSDSANVVPLQRMERQQLDVKKNPFYQHARMSAFVAYRSGVAVGRIVAITDQLHNEYHQDKTGFFGFFESIDDQVVVDQLVEVATEWLLQEGCETMRGPVNPSMKSDFGVLVDGQQYPPTIMMAHTPARYDQHLVSAGFDIAKTFYAFRLVFSQHADEYTPRWEELRTAQAKINARYPQLKFRAIESATYEKTLREINHLGNVVRSEGWGFVPLTEAELDFMIKNLRPVIRFDMIHAAYWDEQLVGYIVNIPDVNWALKRTWGRWDWLRMMQLPFLIRRTPKTRVIALGVDASFRNKGVAMMLIQRLIDRWNEYDEWEFSWVAEDNLKSIRAIERAVPLHQYKTYRLYEKVIG